MGCIVAWVKKGALYWWLDHSGRLSLKNDRVYNQLCYEVALVVSGQPDCDDWMWLHSLKSFFSVQLGWEGVRMTVGRGLWPGGKRAGDGQCEVDVGPGTSSTFRLGSTTAAGAWNRAGN